MIHKKTQIFERTMILLVVASSLMGCSTNQNKIFEQQEYEAKRSNIVFKVQRPDYQIVLDNDNKITQICNVATSSQCNLPKGTGKEVVQISNRQIGLGGYSAITTECGEKNMYAHNNPVERIDSSECSSRFYSISDYHIPVKLIFGVFTLGIPAVHCGVIVSHTDSCSMNATVDAQYSLPGGGTAPTNDPQNATYLDDLNAFNHPGGGNTNYQIPVPAGMTSQQFDQAVQSSGKSYSAPFYDPTGIAGPNSNSAANQIIQGAGGTTPNVPGAVGQYYWNIDY